MAYRKRFEVFKIRKMEKKKKKFKADIVSLILFAAIVSLIFLIIISETIYYMNDNAIILVWLIINIGNGFVIRNIIQQKNQ